MLREEIKIILGSKEYIVKEPTVEMYWISLENPERFITELFLEKNSELPDISQTQLLDLIYKLFDINTEALKEVILRNKETEKKEHDFHIVVAQFMKFFGNSFHDTVNMPFKIFEKIMKDI